VFLRPITADYAVLLKNKALQTAKLEKRPLALTKSLSENYDEPLIVNEEDDEAGIDIQGIPEAPLVAAARARGDDAIVVDHNSDDGAEEDVAMTDDKKDLAFKITYDGFQLFGKALFLIVTRLGQGQKKRGPDGNGTKVMEDWISSTQAEADYTGNFAS
jgi:hypothetical protein